MRWFDAALQPLGGPTLVNSTLQFGNQDEPDLDFDATGKLLVAWSDREGNDGEQMGIFARAYDANMQPLGVEFEVNQIWQASQWRPFVKANLNGGWIVTWSGDWDGNAYFRIFDTDANPRTGDVLVNQYPWDAQVDPDVAVAPNGNIFVPFIDYSSHGGVGSGLNLWGRVFDAAAQPLTNEFLLTTYTSNGDQRNPHVEADAQGHFVVSWDDELSDGSGYGVFARQFDSLGNALGPEFQANDNSAGDEWGSCLACDAAGRFTICWQENSAAGEFDVRARRFDANAQPLGPSFLVANSTIANQLHPDLCADPAGSDVLFAFDRPQGAAGTVVDPYLRRFLRTDGPQVYCTAKLNSLGCLPSVAFSGTPSASSHQAFLVQGQQIVSHKSGLLLYSLSSAFTPFQGGTLCLGSSSRTATQNSGGSAGTNCSGTFSYDFNALIRTHQNPLLAPGATVSAQWYYRDAADAQGFTTGLSDALRFAIEP